MDELDIISTENKAIYEEIKDFAHTLEKGGNEWHTDMNYTVTQVKEANVVIFP